MIVFGITGGSGCGKTTVSEILKKYGVHVIDTDVIAHAVVEKGTECLSELTDAFGKGILSVDDTLNRQKLASIAFSEDSKRELLNSITHKYIKARVSEEIRNSGADIIAIDGAVIIGSCIEPMCEFIVYVTADEDVRLRRIKERDGLTYEQAKQRISAQPSDEFYKRHSKYIIYNNGSVGTLEHDVRRVYEKIKGE